MAATRIQESSETLERLKQEKSGIAELVSQSKRELRRTFEQLRASLKQEEQNLMAEVSRCSAEVTEILGGESSKFREAYTAAQKYHVAGDAVQALNSYSKLAGVLALAAPPCQDLSISAAELKGQLQRGFEARLASIAGLAGEVEEIRVMQVPEDAAGATVLADGDGASGAGAGTAEQIGTAATTDAAAAAASLRGEATTPGSKGGRALSSWVRPPSTAESSALIADGLRDHAPARRRQSGSLMLGLQPSDDRPGFGGGGGNGGSGALWRGGSLEHNPVTSLDRGSSQFAAVVVSSPSQGDGSGRRLHSNRNFGSIFDTEFAVEA